MTSALGVAAARNLATTTKSVPQLAAITPRWLLRMLPWTEVPGGTYRVNRRRSYRVDDGRVQFDTAGHGTVRIVPATLPELPLLRGYADPVVLAALAERFEQRQLAPGDPITVHGEPSDQLILIARGRAERLVPAEHGGEARHGVLGRGGGWGMAGVMEVRPPGEVLAGSRRLVDPALRQAVGTLPAPIRRIAGYHLAGRGAGRPRMVYEETGDAVQQYKNTAPSPEDGSDNAARDTAGTIEGWWDQGAYLETLFVHDGRGRHELARSEISIAYVIQHRNLHLTAYMSAAFPTEETEAAVADLHEILKAFIDEVAAHLTLSTE